MIAIPWLGRRPLALLALGALGALLLARPANADDSWLAPAEASALVNPLAADPAQLERAAEVYARHCATCHGVAGRGDGKGSAMLRVKPRDLRDPAVQQQTDGALYWKIAKGRRPMPGFRAKLDDDDRWRSVLLIRSLGSIQDKSAEDLEGVPLTTNN